MGRVLLAAVLVAWSMTAAAIPFEQLLYEGRAIPFYGPPANASQAQMAGALQRSKLAERMAQIARAVRLRHDVRVGFESCGNPNPGAFYQPSRASIVVCYEMLELVAQLARNDPSLMKADKRTFGMVVDGAIWGIYFHELAHAIISINRMAPTGREEDVADQFAVYIATKFVEPHGVPVVMPTVWLFQQLANQRDISTADQGSIRAMLANEHSLDGQRVFNLACWAYGAGGPFGQDAPNVVSLPQERTVRCQREYASLNIAIRTQFQKFLR
jgi:hypothetical protein